MINREQYTPFSDRRNEDNDTYRMYMDQTLRLHEKAANRINELNEEIRCMKGDIKHLNNVIGGMQESMESLREIAHLLAKEIHDLKFHGEPCDCKKHTKPTQEQIQARVPLCSDDKACLIQFFRID